MSFKKVILTLLATVIIGSIIGYTAGHLLGTKNPDYITRNFVPSRYMNEDDWYEHKLLGATRGL